MLAIPDIDPASAVFGDIKHMPKMADIPDEFLKRRDNPFTAAVSGWFFSGARFKDGVLTVNGKSFRAKPGVDGKKAIVAIQAVLGSFEPKHEHKEAACGFMLSEWFEPVPANPK